MEATRHSQDNLSKGLIFLMVPNGVVGLAVVGLAVKDYIFGIVHIALPSTLHPFHIQANRTYF